MITVAQIQQGNTADSQGMQPTSETKSKCEEPWNDLSTRKQRALLLEGVEITRAFLVQLKELMQMNNDEGEPCGYDEVLQAVLHYGSVPCCTFSHRLLQRPSRLCGIGDQFQQVEQYSDSDAKATPPSPAAQRYYLRKQERCAAPAVLGWARQACSVSAAPTCKGAGAGAGPDVARS